MAQQLRWQKPGSSLPAGFLCATRRTRRAGRARTGASLGGQGTRAPAMPEAQDGGDADCPASRRTLVAGLRGERRAMAKRRHRSPGGRSARLDLREQLDVGRRYWFRTRGQVRLDRAIQPCLMALRRFPHLEHAIARVRRAAPVAHESGCRWRQSRSVIAVMEEHWPSAAIRRPRLAR
jgi:hypothetical protein